MAQSPLSIFLLLDQFGNGPRPPKIGFPTKPDQLQPGLAWLSGPGSSSPYLFELVG